MSLAIGKKFPWWFWAGLIAWCLVIATTWSRVPFWPDADGYTSHVAEGRWVAHPPGYLFFVVLSRFCYLFGLAPYPTVEATSLLLTVLSWPVLYRVFRRVCERREALLLLLLFAFSWNVLLLSRTGTSHASDYLSVSLLLLIVTSQAFQKGEIRAFLFYGFGIVLCCGLRLTTGIMMIPLFALVLFRNRQNLTLWMTYLAAGITVLAMQKLVIYLSGGWVPYQTYTHNMHLGNLGSSVIFSGINSATLLNLGRTMGWAFMGIPWLLLMPFLVAWEKRSSFDFNQRQLLLYGGVSVLGCLTVSGLYLCTHPGYLCAALPGSFACLAALFPMLAKTSRRTFLAGATLLLNIGFFIFARPFVHPSNPMEAAANGLFLQYTGTAFRESVFKTTSGWLRMAGYDDMIPLGRREALDNEAARTRKP